MITPEIELSDTIETDFPTSLEGEKELMQSTPFPCALVAVRIEDVRDHAAAGVQFRGPRYSFHADKEHRKGVEEAIFDELKGPTPTI